MLSLTGLIILAASCAITYLIGWCVCWFIRFMGTPADLASKMQLVVWIVVGVIILLRILRFVGVW
jgi:hypothetical protein